MNLNDITQALPDIVHADLVRHIAEADAAAVRENRIALAAQDKLDELIVTGAGWDQWSQHASAHDIAELDCLMGKIAGAANEVQRIEAQRHQAELFERVLRPIVEADASFALQQDDDRALNDWLTRNDPNH